MFLDQVSLTLVWDLRFRVQCLRVLGLRASGFGYRVRSNGSAGSVSRLQVR